MNEQWKDVIGYEVKYQISNFGRIRSIPRIIGNGKGYLCKEKIKNIQFDVYGYCQISFPQKGRKHKSYKIHQLVARHFINENFPDDFQICHRDRNKLNNHVSNLYIGNQVTNTIDKYKTGSTKLSVSQVNEIRKLLSENKLSQQKIASIFKVRASYISRINTGVRCQHVPNTQLTIEV